ncbi:MULTISPECIES: helix-turn-helix transcriptional regulator [Bacillota]|uniref:helix-turn-helix transcriptional regulator n=1 Tax=Bacillota TaxID=1239 RepID=UPI00195F4D82|nr:MULTISPECIES: helix-turn-helix transcriptional regulator [Bacillota]
MKIINNLKGIRTQRKIAQKQLAMDTGYDPRTIRRVELGECCPSAEFMFDMSDYFGVPIEEYLHLINLQNQYREENKDERCRGQRFKPDK